MRELMPPPEVASDPNATEMIRVWIANKDLHVSLFLGMWEDALDCDVDECDAWGMLLSDVVRHIANGLRQSHGKALDETTRSIRAAFLSYLDAEEGEAFSGAYVDDTNDPQ